MNRIPLTTCSVYGGEGSGYIRVSYGKKTHYEWPGEVGALKPNRNNNYFSVKGQNSTSTRIENASLAWLNMLCWAQATGYIVIDYSEFQIANS